MLKNNTAVASAGSNDGGQVLHNACTTTKNKDIGAKRLSLMEFVSVQNWIA